MKIHVKQLMYKKRKIHKIHSKQKNIQIVVLTTTDDVKCTQ